jgi:hypothetical protein
LEKVSVEHLLVDRQPNEPAKQQVKLQPFDQLPLGADRIEKLASTSTLGKQRPAHPIFAAHLANPRFASPTPENHATKINSRPCLTDFFSSLLG